MQSAHCPQHGVVEKAWPCTRCGEFLCRDCAHRTRPNAMAMCAGCWALRSAHVESLQRKNHNPSQGIVLCGALAAIPLFIPAQLAALIGGGVLLYRREIPARGPLIGMGLALFGLLATVGLVFLSAAA